MPLRQDNDDERAAAVDRLVNAHRASVHEPGESASPAVPLEPPGIASMVDRVRAEFMTMPGLRLLRHDLERLCGIEPPVCQRVLEQLAAAKCLRRHADGTYSRLTEGREASPARSTTAHRNRNRT